MHIEILFFFPGLSNIHMNPININSQVARLKYFFLWIGLKMIQAQIYVVVTIQSESCAQFYCIISMKIGNPFYSVFSGFHALYFYAFGTSKLLKLTHAFPVTHILDRIDSGYFMVKFIHLEKATKFCEIFSLLLTGTTQDKRKVKISQNFLAFSEYMNFNKCIVRTIRYVVSSLQELHFDAS